MLSAQKFAARGQCGRVALCLLSVLDSAKNWIKGFPAKVLMLFKSILLLVASGSICDSHSLGIAEESNPALWSELP
ncbi:MAG: hypothetical protein WA005_08695 [Candidatus Binataceae bacterium]